MANENMVPTVIEYRERGKEAIDFLQFGSSDDALKFVDDFGRNHTEVVRNEKGRIIKETLVKRGMWDWFMLYPAREAFRAQS